MMVLKSESFDYNDDKGLADFVNRNSISKNDIQQIVANNYYILLYYWEEEKEYVPTLNDKKSMYYDHYNINQPNYMHCNYK